MKVGILVPSVYMHNKNYTKRISAPMELSMVLTNGLVKKGVEVIYFSAPEVPVNTKVVSADVSVLDNNLKMDYQQDLMQQAYEAVSFYELKKYFELGVTTKAYEMAKKGDLDLIHVYHAFGNLSHYFAELLNIPTVFTLHVFPPPKGTLERWRYQRFQKQNFIAISQSQKKGFYEFAPDMNITDVIYHGVELDRFTFNSKPDNYLVFMGRLIPQKGLDLAIKVALETGNKLQIATHLTKVTENTSYYQTKIRPFLDNKLIQMRGLLRDEERTILLKNAKAFVFPLQWEEPFGMVIIEAMACGTPVIAYNRGSVPEIIKDGVTGFIVDPDNEDRIGKGSWIIKKQGIEGLIEAVKKIGEIDRKGCRRHVEENFTVSKMVDAYEKTYQKILASQGLTLRS